MYNTPSNMDLLRFQKFTIGNVVCQEFGCSDDGNKANFVNLLRISPLHNVKMPTNESFKFPAVLLATGDHDDRVPPLHSYKLIAELQHTIGGNPRQVHNFIKTNLFESYMPSFYRPIH